MCLYSVENGKRTPLVVDGKAIEPLEAEELFSDAKLKFGSLCTVHIGYKEYICYFGTDCKAFFDYNEPDYEQGRYP